MSAVLKKAVEVGQDAVDLSAVDFAELTPLEHEIHIFDLERLYRGAYARFEAWGLPADREDAAQFLDLMSQALRERPGQVMRHAEFERRLDEGVDFFQVQGGRARAALERRVA